LLTDGQRSTWSRMFSTNLYACCATASVKTWLML
jgi:hypothetical protein